MADAMVTARMSQEKKEAGRRMLEKLGTNPSQAINSLYDYVLEKKQLPFPDQQARRIYAPEEIAEAIAWVDSIPVDDRFSNMTDDEIRQERLISRGLATADDFK
ncbi:MAG: type II toxin-antitoxin system RelB/DinJ family antitoxin [Coriobacteriales bacterium]